MKNFYLLIVLILLSCSDKVSMQEFDSAEIIKTIVLPKTINETSGLEFYNKNFITLNDSGDGPSLYVFNENGDLIPLPEAPHPCQAASLHCSPTWACCACVGRIPRSG